MPCGTKSALLKVFREVGEVVDSVSSRRLVDFFPNVEGTLAVFNDNLGRFGAAGCRCDAVCTIGVDGNIASDIVSAMGI